MYGIFTLNSKLKGKDDYIFDLIFYLTIVYETLSAYPRIPKSVKNVQPNNIHTIYNVINHYKPNEIR